MYGLYRLFLILEKLFEITLRMVSSKRFRNKLVRYYFTVIRIQSIQFVHRKNENVLISQVFIKFRI